MDTFKTTLHSALSNSLIVQKELASLTESQVKLAQAQIAGGFDAWRSAFAASQNATQAMARVWTDSLKAPTAG